MRSDFLSAGLPLSRCAPGRLLGRRRSAFHVIHFQTLRGRLHERQTRRPVRGFGRLNAFAGAFVLAVSSAATAAASSTLLQISSDPYTNAISQDKTEVEPLTFPFGSTIVSAFQVGRIFDGGAAASDSPPRGTAGGRGRRDSSPVPHRSRRLRRLSGRPRVTRRSRSTPSMESG